MKIIRFILGRIILFLDWITSPRPNPISEEKRNEISIEAEEYAEDIEAKKDVVESEKRQVENKIYIIKNKGEESPYLYESEIRSSPEDKFQPARITKIRV